MKNTVKGINILADEEWISNLEDRVVEIIQAEQQKKTELKNWG